MVAKATWKNTKSRGRRKAPRRIPPRIPLPPSLKWLEGIKLSKPGEARPEDPITRYLAIRDGQLPPPWMKSAKEKTKKKAKTRRAKASTSHRPIGRTRTFNYEQIRAKGQEVGSQRTPKTLGELVEWTEEACRKAKPRIRVPETEGQSTTMKNILRSIFRQLKSQK